MKKRILPLLLCIMLVVGMMPTTAFAGVTDTWDVDLIVSKNTALQYNGQDTVEIGFAVQSDNLMLKNMQRVRERNQHQRKLGTSLKSSLNKIS